MKAAVLHSSQRGCLGLCEVADPVEVSNESLIAVTGSSLNRGELRRAQSTWDETQTGWDLVAMVEKATYGGSGLTEGKRVISINRYNRTWTATQSYLDKFNEESPTKTTD